MRAYDDEEQTEISPHHPHTGGLAGWAESVSFWLLVGTLAWAPFPLGSNRPWSWSLMVFLVAACWLIWSVAIWTPSPERLRAFRRLLVPGILAGGALAWALIQTVSWMPAGWVHPVWQLGQDLLERPLPGAISIEPRRTITEAMKLLTYAAVAVLVYMMSARSERAKRLLDALMVIGAFYALYSLALGITGFKQESLFYTSRTTGNPFAGPFVSRNSFATYAGLAVLCASVRISDAAGHTLIVGRGARQFAVSAIYFIFGVGAVSASVFLVTFAMLAATGSRAGFMACLVGIGVLMLLSGIIAGRRLTRGWAIIGVAAVVAVMAILFSVTGDTLSGRFDAMVETGEFDQTRLILWQSAMRMIGDSPLLGLGLGSFEPAYPLYADRVLPFIMDKVHNDYLEFAAGLGLPAAFAWWGALLWLMGMCVRGVFIRRRNRQYAQLAIAATALVGFHSIFDFSLQIPAIALTYAAILGLGVGQSAPTRNVERD